MTIRTALDVSESALHAEDAQFVSFIRTSGWAHTTIAEDKIGPGFSYTTGLWVTLGVPEIILFALQDTIAHQVLWDLFRDFEKGLRFEAGLPTSDIFGNSQACLMPVAKTHYRDYLGRNRWFYGNDDFPCQQLIWPDRHGLFPWDEGVIPSVAVDQPDLSGEGWPHLIQRH